MGAEASFVLKRGEGLHDSNMIKHKVLNVETPRVDITPKMAPLKGNASSAESTPKRAPLDATRPVKTSYVSSMARARAERKRREVGQSKDWDDTSSSPCSEMSSISNGSTPPSKPARVNAHSGGLLPPSGNLIPGSGGLIPSSGYIAKPRDSTASDGRAGLPKFGVWDNLNDAAEPCYTLLFDNVAQEKRSGGPIRVHANQPGSPGRNEDLYKFNPGAIKVRKSKHSLHHSLLCCFVGS